LFQSKNLKSHFRPSCCCPLSRAINDVAELLRDRRRLRAEAVEDGQDVVAAVANLLNASHVANLKKQLFV
jgi:hypothetical protein